MTEENTPGEGGQDPTPPTVEELQAQLKESQAATEKISNDYKSVEKERNQLESGIRSIGVDLERNNLGRISMDGSDMKIEIGQQQQNQKSEIDLLKDKKSDLKRQYDNGDLDNDDYYSQLTDVTADIKVIERMGVQDKKNQQAEQAKIKELSRTQGIAKIKSDFPDAYKSGSELLTKINELAREGVDYNDPAMFYEIARSASNALGQNNNQGGGQQNMDGVNDMTTLTNGGGGVVGQTTGSQDGISAEQTKELTVKFGKEGASRINKMLSNNIKMGTLDKNDTNMMHGRVYLSVD